MSSVDPEYTTVEYNLDDPDAESRALAEVESLKQLGWRELFDDQVGVPTEDEIDASDPWHGAFVRKIHLYRDSGQSGVREPRRPSPRSDEGRREERP